MKMNQVSAYATITRKITGKTTVSVFALSNMNLEAGTATFIHEGLKYDAVIGPKTAKHSRSWYLTGDYTY